jgi:proteasome lid subunit RPN8/RPN11
MDLSVLIDEELVDTILEGARRLHPREAILLLRGKKKKNVVTISELIVPPLATHGKGFASMPIHMLPMDFSIVGTVHSHPSGNLTPSSVDLNHSFGQILMIVGFPFAGEKDVAVYSHGGERLALQIVKP